MTVFFVLKSIPFRSVLLLILLRIMTTENSAEYQTMICLTNQLRLAVRSELISLSGSLLSIRLISPDNETELRNTSCSEAERSARLVELVQNKVQQNPRHYCSFIGILQESQDRYRDILQQLEHTYREYQRENGPNATDISSHICSLEYRFRLLHERIQSELIGHRIGLPRLLSSLKVIPTEFRQEYNMSIHEVFPELRSEPGIREAFYHLSPLIDFLSCGLLNFLIGEFGSNTLKAMMKSYDVDLIRFMKETTVKQLMDVWSSQQVIPPNFSKLRAQLDQDPASYTLYDLDWLRRQFCGAVRLTEIVSVLIGLKSANSFIAEWIVPSTLIPLLMEFAKKLDSGYYLHEHILKMTVDEIQIYPILPDTMSKPPALQAAAATATVKPKVYFHIKNKQEVRLIEATGTDVVTPPRSAKFTYYKTECTYPQDNDGSTINDERSICLPHVDENLRNFLAAMKKDSSVEGILFQARFGRMFFSFPRRFYMDVVSTDYLQQDIRGRKTFLFKFPASFNSQNFIQRCCDSTSVTSQERYKIKFKQFADDGNLIRVGCHMEEHEDGTFKHIWTRVDIKSDETERAWPKNLNIVRPGRHVDMCIVSHLQTPCCKEDDTAAYEISERIANSMTRNLSGDLSMQVAAQDFCVVFIHKKITKTYTWIDPTNRNQSWTITELYVNNTQHMEDEYLRMRQEGNHRPVTVRFNDQIKEIYFSGNTHVTKPSDDPNIKVPTPDEFVANFKMFVEASFDVADLLADPGN